MKKLLLLVDPEAIIQSDLPFDDYSVVQSVLSIRLVHVHAIKTKCSWGVVLVVAQSFVRNTIWMLLHVNIGN